MSHVNRQRAQALMQRNGLDVLVLSKPENYKWATGAHPGVASFFRRAGACLAIVPADPSLSIRAITTDLFAPLVRKFLGDDCVLTHTDWVETADIRSVMHEGGFAAQLTTQVHQHRVSSFHRPATFDARNAFKQLKELLLSTDLYQKRIGLDMDFWPIADYRLLCEFFPSIVWLDASAAISEIKVVKSKMEIDHLTHAAIIAEDGMKHAISHLHEGIHRHEIAQAWAEGVSQSAKKYQIQLTGQWEYITVGAMPWQGGGQIQTGDVIKFDVGCLVDGYSSDSGRTFVCGQPRPRTQEIANALHDAFTAGLEALKPGYPMSEVYRLATQAMHRAGFKSFQRGHFGHSLGHDTFCEVPPFLSAQSEMLIEPQMMLAFETPFYVDGDGGFIIEDQFLITEHGAQAVWTLPRHLVSF